jgi:uroporphyrinogen-III decarboxylase
MWPPIVERPARAGKDDFGVSWAYDATGTYPAPGGYVITDIEKWKEQVVFPDPETYDWGEVRRTAEAVDRKEHLIQGVCEMGIFERSYLLLGMEEALMAYITNTDEMYELCGAIADYKIEFLRAFHDAGKFDIVWYGDDWGTQTNLFVPPEIWRRVIKPHTKRIYDCMKERGVIINQHSCGRIESIFGDLCEIGADMWNPCQPCNDLKTLKEQFGGRVTFVGGIDSQFVLDNPLKTPDDIRREVRKRIDEMAYPQGGYIADPSHSVPYDKEKLAAMENEIRDYGKAVYRRQS